jgi:glycosyltransferase involved in cell wall biosynthesis
LDTDGQHDPRDIPRLIEPILRGEADVVIGSRFLSEVGETPKYRRLGVSVITKLVKSYSYGELTDAQSGFRAYSGKALQFITPAEQGMGASTEIVLKAKEHKLKVMEVPIKISYQVERSSKLNPLYHGTDVVLSTLKHLSLRHPLMFYGTPGLVALAIGIFFGAWAFDMYAKQGRLITNIFLISIFGFIAGLILITTGIILFTVVSLIREK